MSKRNSQPTRAQHDTTLRTAEARIAELERERDRYLDALIARHGGEPVALLAELDEAREDAERLRWQYRKYVATCHATGLSAELSYTQWVAAIDAARKGKLHKICREKGEMR